MPEKSLDWLTIKFGVNPSSLSEELQQLARELGPEGIAKLKLEGAPNLHRGEDPVSVAEKLARIEETGGLEKWRSAGARKVKGDKPEDWITDEQLQVGKKMFKED